MSTRAVFLTVALLLPGCSLWTKAIPAPTPPVPARCDALCTTPCDTKPPQWQPTDAQTSVAWQELIEQVVFGAVALAEQCDVHRQACVQCLDRLKAADVIE